LLFPDDFYLIHWVLKSLGIVRWNKTFNFRLWRQQTTFEFTNVTDLRKKFIWWDESGLIWQRLKINFLNKNNMHKVFLEHLMVCVWSDFWTSGLCVIRFLKNCYFYFNVFWNMNFYWEWQVIINFLGGIEILSMVYITQTMRCSKASLK
jgi:hypothetical protein